MGPPSSFMCSHHSLPDAPEMRGNPWVMSTSTCPPSLLRSEAWDHPISTKLCRSCKNKCYISPSVAKNDLGFSSCNGKESPQKERHTAAPRSIAHLLLVVTALESHLASKSGSRRKVPPPSARTAFSSAPPLVMLQRQ